MITLHPVALSTGADPGEVEARFQPIFQRIAQAADAGGGQAPLDEALAWLKQAGFGALRVPREHGGGGVSLPQLFVLLIELAEADVAVVQALQSHLSFVENCVNAAPGPLRTTWFDRIVEGDLVSEALWDARQEHAESFLQLRRRRNDWIVKGSQRYDSSCLRADWLMASAFDATAAMLAVAAIDTRRNEIHASDAAESLVPHERQERVVRFKACSVDRGDVMAVAPRFRYEPAFHQLLHLSKLAGIGRAIERDLTREIRTGDLESSACASVRASERGLQQAVGKISAWVYAAEATALRAAKPAQRAYEAHFLDSEEGEREANFDAEIESAQGEVAVSDLIARASKDVTTALHSAGRECRRGSLDRHWLRALAVPSHTLLQEQRIVGDWRINGHVAAALARNAVGAAL